jgi:hypothetical protein
MAQETNYYYVSPPDFLMKTTDYTIMILGVKDKDRVKEIAAEIEKRLQTFDIIFYYNDSDVNDRSLAWVRNLITQVDMVIVDLDNITKEELMISVFSEVNSSIPGLYISKSGSGYLHDIFKSFEISPITDYTDLADAASEVLELLEQERSNK